MQTVPLKAVKMAASMDVKTVVQMADSTVELD